VNKAEFIQHLQQLVIEAGSQKDLANRLKISTPYLNDVLQGRRDPGKKILAALGFEQVVIYQPKNQS